MAIQRWRRQTKAGRIWAVVELGRQYKKYMIYVMLQGASEIEMAVSYQFSPSKKS